MAERKEPVDVLVIGAGASGAAFTWSLRQAGIQVMCLGQGDWLDPHAYPPGRDDWELYRQHAFNPDPNLRHLPADYPVNNTALLATNGAGWIRSVTGHDGAFTSF